MKFGSSGILTMDLQSSYLSEVGIRVSLLIFYILGYILQIDRYLVFGILYYRSSLLCSVLSGFSLSSVFWLILGVILTMQYSGDSIAKQCYQVSIIRHLYIRKCRRCPYSDYCSVDLRALHAIVHILIGIIHVPVPFVFILPLNEIARTQFL